MKLLGSTKSNITKDRNAEKVPCLEITEVVLVKCNTAYDDYQKNSTVMYTFLPNKSIGQLLDISPTNFIFGKTFNSEFPISIY